MQLVINIDDKLYNRIKYLEPRADSMLDELMRSVQNGTPLPKGHGKLVDKEKLGLTDFEILMCKGSYKEGLKMLLKKIDNASTIIEAE